MFIPAAAPVPAGDRRSGPMALAEAYGNLQNKRLASTNRMADAPSQMNQQVMGALQQAALTTNQAFATDAQNKLAEAQSLATRAASHEAALQRLDNLIVEEQSRVDFATATMAGTDNEAVQRQQQAIIDSSNRKIMKYTDQASKIFMNDEMQRLYAEDQAKRNLPMGQGPLANIASATAGLPGADGEAMGPVLGNPGASPMQRVAPPVVDVNIQSNDASVSAPDSPLTTAATPKTSVKKTGRVENPMMHWLMNLAPNIWKDITEGDKDDLSNPLGL